MLFARVAVPAIAETLRVSENEVAARALRMIGGMRGADAHSRRSDSPA